MRNFRLSRKHCVAALRVSVALVLLVSACKQAAAQQSLSPGLPFKRGETLVYQAEFNKGLLRGIDVAEFTFNADVERAQGEAYSNVGLVHLIGDVTSKGLFLKLFGFHFHEHVESSLIPSARFPMFDTNPFDVWRTNKIEEQGKRRTASEAVFNHQTREVTWIVHDMNQNQPAQPRAVKFSEPIQDVLTVIYFLRTQKLGVGKSFDVPLTDSGRVFRFSVAVLERKQIKTVLGSVSTLRVVPSLFGEDGLVQTRGSLSIWITDDARRLPVKAQLKVEMGTFDIKLKRVSFNDPKLARRRLLSQRTDSASKEQ